MTTGSWLTLLWLACNAAFAAGAWYATRHVDKPPQSRYPYRDGFDNEARERRAIAAIVRRLDREGSV